jgi:hypothetical protein
MAIMKNTKTEKKNMSAKSKKIVKRIMKNPDAYLARYTIIEYARKLTITSEGKAHFIFKVENQFWVMHATLAKHFAACGFERTY